MDKNTAAQFEASGLKKIMSALKITFNFVGIAESKLSQKYSKESTACKLIIQGATKITAEESIGNIKMQYCISQ